MTLDLVRFVEALVRRIERHSPAADRAATTATDEQTHINHTLLSIIIGGIVGSIVWLALLVQSIIEMPYTRAVAIGFLTMLVGYIEREVRQHKGLRFGWDGTLDVLVPSVMLLPWSLSAIVGVVPWWTGVLFITGALIIGRLYWFRRPET